MADERVGDQLIVTEVSLDVEETSRDAGDAALDGSRRRHGLMADAASVQSAAIDSWRTRRLFLMRLFRIVCPAFKGLGILKLDATNVVLGTSLRLTMSAASRRQCRLIRSFRANSRVREGRFRCVDGL